MFTRGSVLIGFAAAFGLSSCGSDQRKVVGTARFPHQDRIGYVIGAKLSPRQLTSVESVRAKLLTEPWIGVDAENKVIENTSLKFYSGPYDLKSSTYQYKFDLFYYGRALQGRTQITKGPNGEINGFITTPAYDWKICIDPKISGLYPYAFHDSCIQNSSRQFVGSLITFSPVLSEKGALLHMKFKQPLGDEVGYRTTEIDFEEISKVSP